MKTSNVLKLLPVVAAAMLSTAALADTPAAAPAAAAPSAPVVSSHMQKVDATIKAIDAPSRTLTLDGPNGLVTVQVGKQAKKFDQLKVGDRVTVSYYQGLAAQMKHGDAAKATAPVGSEFASANKNGPGGIVGASVTTTVTIQAVDLPTNTVSFKRADGSVHVIEVKNPKMRKFIKTLKPGDVVEVTYTESVAIDVQPAA
jgi:translation initiation factor IF-1